jgi:hypothetical protein
MVILVRRTLLEADLINGSMAETRARQPSAELTFPGGIIVPGVEATCGGGFLHFGGHGYAFTVRGLSAIDVGLAQVAVYNPDFPDEGELPCTVWPTLA